MSMSGAPNADLVSMFRDMRSDARSDPKPVELAESFVIDMGFDGGGLLPVIGSAVVLPLGNIRARITDAVIVANGVGSAIITLQLGTLADVPNLGTIYAAGIAPPTLTGTATAVLDITSWQLNLQPSDVLIATLTTVSSAIASPALGAMTCVTLSLYCRRLKWPSGLFTTLDSSGNTLTTTSGATITLRT